MPYCKAILGKKEAEFDVQASVHRKRIPKHNQQNATLHS
jgi:hypothetical protein